MPEPVKIRDVVRGSLVHEKMGDPEFRKKVLEHIAQKFKITRIKDRYKEPTEYGYKDVLVNVEGAEGLEHEIQLHEPRNFNLREKTHDQYVRLKKVKKEGDKDKEKSIHADLKDRFRDASKRPITVALLDDHKYGIDQVKSIYKGEKYDFHYFDSFRKLREHGKHWNVVYLDYDLGKGKPTGLDVLPQVKDMADRVVGFSDQEKHDQMMKTAGADDFVLKIDKHTTVDKK